MLLRAPIYLLLVVLSAGYLIGSNLMGWSPGLLFASKPTAQRTAPVRHK
jgi:hypothetical protein